MVGAWHLGMLLLQSLYMIALPVLVLPGLSSSGPDHWQTLWESENPQFSRVEQQDWFDPDPGNWVRQIDASIALCKSPPVLIAHSLATIALAHWASKHSRPVYAAFLVAPADVESPSPHSELLQAFCPIPRGRLPFPSLVVASTNDPYGSLDRIRGLSSDWGSELVVAGALGHINANSGIGSWPEGQRIFRDWLSSLDF